MSESEPFPEDALRKLCLADPVFKERYDGWELAGEGAYGSVVRSRFLGQPIALKIFTQLSEEGRKRFRTEFASAVRVTSPFAVRTYSAFERGPLCWIEMEAVDGVTLREELERRKAAGTPFPLPEALEIARAVAAALAEAHGAGIIHRDLKPANILLPHSGKPIAKLGDFGIARIAGSTKVTATGAFPGTPTFGAPEAFAGRGVGPPADIYALSLCLYALFTNNGFPWVLPEDAPIETLIDLHVRKTPRSLRSLEPRVPPALNNLVLQGLEKRPERRPTGAELAERLREISIESPSPPRRRPAWVSVAFLLGAVLLGGVLLHGARSSSPEKLPATPLPAASLATLSPSPPPLSIAFRSAFVHLANGSKSLSDIRVTLRSEGGLSVFVLPRLAAQETADVALDAFAPLPRKPFQEVRVQAKPEGQGVLEWKEALSD